MHPFQSDFSALTLTAPWQGRVGTVPAKIQLLLINLSHCTYRLSNHTHSQCPCRNCMNHLRRWSQGSGAPRLRALCQRAAGLLPQTGCLHFLGVPKGTQGLQKSRVGRGTGVWEREAVAQHNYWNHLQIPAKCYLERKKVASKFAREKKKLLKFLSAFFCGKTWKIKHNTLKLWKKKKPKQNKINTFSAKNPWKVPWETWAWWKTFAELNIIQFVLKMKQKPW